MHRSELRRFLTDLCVFVRQIIVQIYSSCQNTFGHKTFSASLSMRRIWNSITDVVNFVYHFRHSIKRVNYHITLDFKTGFSIISFARFLFLP